MLKKLVAVAVVLAIAVVALLLVLPSGIDMKELVEQGLDYTGLAGEEDKDTDTGSKAPLLPVPESELKGKIVAESKSLMVGANYLPDGRISELRLSDTVHSQMQVKVHREVIQRLDGFQNDKVGVTHVSDSGQISHRVVTLEYAGDFAVLDLEFSENIISGFTGYTRYTASGVTGNTTISFSGDMDVSSLTGSITNNLGGSSSALSYWPEGTTSSDRFWFKVPELAGSETRHYIATKESGHSPSISNTMVFGDDFSAGVLDTTNKWTVSGGSESIVNGELVVNGDYIYSKTSFPVNTAFGTRIKTNALGAIGAYTQYGYTAAWHDVNHRDSDAYRNKWTNNAGSSYSSISTSGFTTNTYYTVDIKRDGISSVNIFSRNGDNQVTNSQYFSTLDSPLKLRSNSGSTETLYIDWVFVRKYAATEPTVTVTDIGTYYLITVQNNIATALTDYQVSFPANQIGLSSVTESILIAEASDVDFTASIADASSTKTLEGGDTESFSLTPTEPASGFSITTDAPIVSYDYDFTAHWTEDVMLFDESTNGTAWNASVFHDNTRATDGGYIEFTPAFKHLRDITMVSSNSEATFTYSGGKINISVGALSSHDEHWYNFTATYAVYDIVMRAYDPENMEYIQQFTGYIGEEYKTTNNGILNFNNVANGTYTIGAFAGGYVANSTTWDITEDEIITLTLNPAEGSGGDDDDGFESGTGSYYAPHTAEFIYMSYWGARIPDVSVTVYLGDKSTVFPGGVLSPDAEAVFNGTTGDTGAAVFQMARSTTYTLYAVGTNPAFTKISSFAPKDNRYYIFIGYSPFTDTDTPSDGIYYGAYGKKVNMTSATISSAFEDVSNSTTFAEWWVEDAGGNRVYYANTSDSTGSWDVTVNINDGTYYSYFRIASSVLTEPKLVTKTFRFYHTVHPTFDLGFTEQWHYQLLAGMVIMLVAGLFTIQNVQMGAIVAIILAWLGMFVGYIAPSTTTNLALALASLVAIIFYLRKQEAFS